MEFYFLSTAKDIKWIMVWFLIYWSQRKLAEATVNNRYLFFQKEKMQQILDIPKYCIPMHKCIFDTWNSNKWNHFMKNHFQVFQYLIHGFIVVEAIAWKLTFFSMMFMSTFEVHKHTVDTTMMFPVQCLTQFSFSTLRCF